MCAYAMNRSQLLSDQQCIHGHPRTGANTGWSRRKDGRLERFCRVCRNAAQRRHYAGGTYKPVTKEFALKNLIEGIEDPTVYDLLKDCGVELL